MAENTYNVGIYCRLSNDDERDGESVSIENQELMLFQFLQYHSLLFTPAPAIHAGYPREYPPKEFAAASRYRLSAWCGRSR